MLSLLLKSVKYVRVVWNSVRPLLEIALRKKVMVATVSAGGATALIPMEMRVFLSRQLLSRTGETFGALFGTLGYLFPWLEYEVFEDFREKVYEASSKVRYPYGVIVFE